jgi:hypothetical protein
MAYVMKQSKAIGYYQIPLKEIFKYMIKFMISIPI